MCEGQLSRRMSEKDIKVSQDLRKVRSCSLGWYEWIKVHKHRHLDAEIWVVRDA